MEQATGAAGAAPSAAGHIAAFLELIGHVMHHNKEKQSLHHAHAEAKLLLKVPSVRRHALAACAALQVDLTTGSLALPSPVSSEASAVPLQEQAHALTAAMLCVLALEEGPAAKACSAGDGSAAGALQHVVLGLLRCPAPAAASGAHSQPHAASWRAALARSAALLLARSAEVAAQPGQASNVSELVQASLAALGASSSTSHVSGTVVAPEGLTVGSAVAVTLLSTLAGCYSSEWGSSVTAAASAAAKPGSGGKGKKGGSHQQHQQQGKEQDGGARDDAEGLRRAVAAASITAMLQTVVLGLATSGWGKELRAAVVMDLLPPALQAASALLPAPAHLTWCKLVSVSALASSLGCTCPSVPPSVGGDGAAAATAAATAAAAAEQSAGSAPAAAVASALEVACLLETHVLAACGSVAELAVSQGAGTGGLDAAAPAAPAGAPTPRPVLHALIQRGLGAKDSSPRLRAAHLLKGALAVPGAAPAVTGFGPRQWEGFLAIFRAQEEYVLHLVQPTWDTNFPVLLEPLSQPGASQPGDAAAGVQDGWEGYLVWLGVLLRRCANHSNASVRRMGLMSFFTQGQSVLKPLLAAPGPRAALTQLLTQGLLPALESDKLVSLGGSGSATARQARMMAALSKALASFLGACLHGLLRASPPDPGQASKEASHGLGAAKAFLLSLLACVAEVSQRAATAVVLLQAMAEAVQTAAAGSGQLPLLMAGEVRSHLLPLLSHIHYLRPEWQRRPARAAVLQIAAVTVAVTKGAGSRAQEAAGTAATLQDALALLAACSDSGAVAGSTSQGSTAATVGGVAAGGSSHSIEAALPEPPAINPPVWVTQVRSPEAGADTGSMGPSLLAHPSVLEEGTSCAVAAGRGFAAWLASTCGQASSTGGTSGTGLGEWLRSALAPADAGSSASWQPPTSLGSLHALAAALPLLNPSAQLAAAQALEQACACMHACIDEGAASEVLAVAGARIACLAAGVLRSAGAVASSSSPGTASAAVPRPHELDPSLLSAAAQAVPTLLAVHTVLASGSTESQPGLHQQQQFKYQQRLLWLAWLRAAVSAALGMSVASIPAPTGSSAGDAGKLEGATLLGGVRARVVAQLASWQGSWLEAALEGPAPAEPLAQATLLASTELCLMGLLAQLPAPVSTASTPSGKLPWSVCVLQRLCSLGEVPTAPSGAGAGAGAGAAAAAAVLEGACGDYRLRAMARVAQLMARQGQEQGQGHGQGQPLAASVQPQLRLLKAHVFDRCLEEAGWAGAPQAAALVEVLLACAPWSDLLTDKLGPAASGNEAEAEAPQQEAARQAVERLLKEGLPSLVREVRRAGPEAAPRLIALAFHPAALSDRALQPLLLDRCVPWVLAQGGARLAVALASHLASQVLLPGSPLLHALLPHAAHLLAFSLWAADPPTVTATTAAGKVDPALALPPRIVLAAHVARIARDGSDPAFIRALLARLLAIVRGGAVPTHQLPSQPQLSQPPLASQQDVSQQEHSYGWLAGREAGQGSAANGVRVAAWQALCLVAPHVGEGAAAAEALSNAWACLLSAHQHANVRPWAQLAVLALLRAHPPGVDSHLLPAVEDYSGQAGFQVCVSVVLVACFHALVAGPGAPHFMRLLQSLLPWALHHRHALCVPVQVLLHAVLSRHGPVLRAQLGPADAAVLQQIQAFLSTNAEACTLRARTSLAAGLEGFDLDFETSVEGVFGLRPGALQEARVEVAGPAAATASSTPSAPSRSAVAAASGAAAGAAAAGPGPDGETDGTGLAWHVAVRDRLPLDLLAALPGALKAVSRAARGGGTGAAATAGSSTATEAGSAAAASGGDGEGDASDEEEEEEEGGLDGGEGEGLTGEGSRSKASVKSQGQGASGSAAAAAGGAGGSAAFTQLRPLLAPPSQQPSQGSVAAVGAGGAESAAAWWPVVLGPEAGARLDALAAGKAPLAPPGLVVVASLLDNVPNLAGLCRTCESMGCEALAIPSRAVAATDAFKKQSVTSERWLRLLEVAPPDVPAFLAERKAAGYAVVGVEQASHSVQLHTFHFPERCLLLLGNEQNGIPPPLLALCDHVVEIQMLGVTRSLNAHVTGAMVVWQYTKQRRLGGGGAEGGAGSSAGPA